MSKINEAIRSICFNSIFNVCRQPQIIISSLMVFVEVFFNFTKVMNDEVIDDLNKKMPEILRTNFEPIIKTLSVKIKECQL